MTTLRPDQAPERERAVEGSSVAMPGELGGTLVGPSALEQLLAKGRVRATLMMLGPAFVASVAYVDPGNFATNVQGGAQFGYLLLWVVLAANLMAMLIQYLSAKLGNRHRPQPTPRWCARTSRARSRGACGSRRRSWRCRPTSPSSSARRSG